MIKTAEQWAAELVAECVSGRYPENVTDLVPPDQVEQVKRYARSDLGALARWCALVEAGSISIYAVPIEVRDMVEQYRVTLRFQRKLRQTVRKRNY